MKRDRRTPLARAEAEALATAALGWIAADPDRIGAFLAETGTDVAGLRAAAADPGFLGFVLDHLLADEAALLGFAAAAPCDPHDIARARAGLPGGDLPHWT